MKPEYQCPDCKGHTFTIDVIDPAVVRFEADQEHTVLETGAGDLEWDDSNACICEACGKRGKLADFKQHVLYVTSDTDVPSAILDRNGEVVLSQCRNCGRGEIELEEPCTPRQPDPVPERPTVQPDWRRCEELSNVPEIHAAFGGFSEDPTADNATGVVRAIIHEIDKQRGTGYGLRALLASVYGCNTSVYVEGHDLLDTRELPHIDFKRDTLAEIKSKIMARSSARSAARTALLADMPFRDTPDDQLAFSYRQMVKSHKAGLKVNFVTGLISLPPKPKGKS